MIHLSLIANTGITVACHHALLNSKLHKGLTVIPLNTHTQPHYVTFTHSSLPCLLSIFFLLPSIKSFEKTYIRLSPPHLACFYEVLVALNAEKHILNYPQAFFSRNHTIQYFHLHTHPNHLFPEIKLKIVRE